MATNHLKADTVPNAIFPGWFKNHSIAKQELQVDNVLFP